MTVILELHGIHGQYSYFLDMRGSERHSSDCINRAFALLGNEYYRSCSCLCTQSVGPPFRASQNSLDLIEAQSAMVWNQDVTVERLTADIAPFVLPMAARRRSLANGSSDHRFLCAIGSSLFALTYA